MENRPEGKVHYIVERSTAGRWHVSEEGFDEPIASFQEKYDAIEYALRLTDAHLLSTPTIQ